VDVDEAAGKALDERVAEDAHEAREHDQPGRIARHGVGERPVEGRAVGVVAWRQRSGGDALCRSPREPLGLRLVADHRTDVDGQRAVRRPVGDCPQVAAGARDQYDDRQRRGRVAHVMVIR